MVILYLISLLFPVEKNTLVLDQPPCWCNFEIESENELYYSVISRFKSDSLKKPWESKWLIETFSISGIDTSKIWASEYFYDGYPEGLLSNNGEVYAYVNEWYYEESGIVKIYRSGDLLADIKGKEFNIPDSELLSTVSHKIWLNEGAYKRYDFVYNDSLQPISLMINTIDKSQHFYNCLTGIKE